MWVSVFCDCLRAKNKVLISSFAVLNGLGNELWLKTKMRKERKGEKNRVYSDCLWLWEQLLDSLWVWASGPLHSPQTCLGRKARKTQRHSICLEERLEIQHGLSASRPPWRQDWASPKGSSWPLHSLTTSLFFMGLSDFPSYVNPRHR